MFVHLVLVCLCYSEGLLLGYVVALFRGRGSSLGTMVTKCNMQPHECDISTLRVTHLGRRLKKG